MALNRRIKNSSSTNGKTLSPRAKLNLIFLLIIFLFSINAYSQEKVKGVILIWDFDEGSGYKALDHSGNGLEGTIIEAEYIPGGIGSCLEFEGDSYVKIADTKLLNPDVITLEAWINSRDVSKTQDIIRKGEQYYLLIEEEMLKFGFFSEGKWEISSSLEPITNNIWHHAVSTFDGSKLQMYVNGELKNTFSFKGNLPTTNRPLMVGSGPDLRQFNGYIDEVKIYNRVLTEKEINENYLSAKDKIKLPAEKPKREVPMTVKVFEDLNKNGFLDKGEQGLAGIQVSEGREIFITDSNGSCSFAAEVGVIPFVFITRPSGYKNTTPFYQRITAEGKEGMSNFGLFTAPETNNSNFSFAQITDPHVTTAITSFIEGINEINSFSGKLAFVVATGDLTTDGREWYENYQEGIRELRLPLYNVIGNHDIPQKNYEDFLGPTYYSFDYGKKHFIVLSIKPQSYYTWLKNDLDLQPENKEIIVFQHYPPDKPLLDILSQYNTRAICYGHWHSNKVFFYEKILVVSTPPLGFGGIDCSPRGFRVVEFREDKLTTELRLTGVREKLTVVSPAGEVISKSGIIQIRASIYDTISKVKKVECNIDQNEWEEMRSGGGWLWQKDYNKKVPQGSHKVKIRVTFDSGKTLEKESEFDVVSTANSPQLAWVQYTGGEISLSSPLLAKGRLYVTSQDNNEAKNGGITCLDAVNGKILWKFKADSSINGSPAFSDDIICIVSVTGTVSALDGQTGKELWRYKLGNNWERWVYSSPVISEGVIYCGVAPYFVALDLKTGKEIWRAEHLGSDWISCYGSPAVDDKAIYVGFNWGNGLFALNKQTGSILWNKKEELAITHSSPVISNNAVYYAADSKLYAFEKETGKELWRSELKGGWTVSSPAIKDSTLAIGSPNGNVFAFDANSGQRLWPYSTGTAIGSFSPYQIGNAQVMSSPMIFKDKLYIGSNDGNFYLLDLKTGQELWHYDLGVPILSSTVISDHILYITTYDGNCYAFTTGL